MAVMMAMTAPRTAATPTATASIRRSLTLSAMMAMTALAGTSALRGPALVARTSVAIVAMALAAKVNPASPARMTAVYVAIAAASRKAQAVPTKPCRRAPVPSMLTAVRRHGTISALKRRLRSVRWSVARSLSAAIASAMKMKPVKAVLPTVANAPVVVVNRPRVLAVAMPRSRSASVNLMPTAARRHGITSVLLKSRSMAAATAEVPVSVAMAFASSLRPASTVLKTVAFVRSAVTLIVVPWRVANSVQKTVASAPSAAMNPVTRTRIASPAPAIAGIAAATTPAKLFLERTA